MWTGSSSLATIGADSYPVEVLAKLTLVTNGPEPRLEVEAVGGGSDRDVPLTYTSVATIPLPREVADQLDSALWGLVNCDQA
jgi:hypothetical protein